MLFCLDDTRSNNLIYAKQPQTKINYEKQNKNLPKDKFDRNCINLTMVGLLELF